MSSEENRIQKIRKNIKKFVRHPDKTYPQTVKYCTTVGDVNHIDPIEFESVQAVASNLCDMTIETAVHFVNSKFEELLIPRAYDTPRQPPKKTRYWPEIRNFKLTEIRMLIKDYVSKWNLSPNIKFCVKYKSTTKSCVSMLHSLEAIFSIPTPECPNPQAIARAFFTVEVSAAVPDSLPIFVTYKFEMFNQTHTADGRFDFQNRLIKIILKCKTQFYESLDF